MIENITDNKKTLAIIVRSSYSCDGIKFFTPNDFSQQLGYMNRPKGYEILPHCHKKVQRKVETTNETLLIRSGKIRVDFYNLKNIYLKSKILHQGDVILLVAGGHGFYMLEKSEIIEIKQGPYKDSDIDKDRFKSIKKEEIIIE